MQVQSPLEKALKVDWDRCRARGRPRVSTAPASALREALNVVSRSTAEGGYPWEALEP
jgi:hypothetical protein